MVSLFFICVLLVLLFLCLIIFQSIYMLFLEYIPFVALQVGIPLLGFIVVSVIAWNLHGQLSNGAGFMDIALSLVVLGISFYIVYLLGSLLLSVMALVGSVLGTIAGMAAGSCSIWFEKGLSSLERKISHEATSGD